MNQIGSSAKTSGADEIRTAYARWANNYDFFFNLVMSHSRSVAARTANNVPGVNLLEVGVGTGLALPFYSSTKRIVGIDLSPDMLIKAHNRIAALQLHNVEALLEMNAQATNFQNGEFDIAVAMFVASVVPDPRALLTELRRIVKPGGTIVFVNHFALGRGMIGFAERALAPASARLGWHADFRLHDIFSPSDIATATVAPMRPFGLFQLICLGN
jgi:phosphatidylethanolamine/phosphatidyl-N-methylethanolamine N-methyltransferase